MPALKIVRDFRILFSYDWSDDDHSNLVFRIKEHHMLHYLWIALIGFVAGLIARALHPGKDNLGFIMTAVLGVAGSFGATFLGQALGWYGPGENAGFLMSILGAVVLLVIYGLIVKKKDGSN